MADQRLQDSVRTTLDGSGNGQVTFGPSRAGLSWIIRGISVQASSNTLEPIATVYKGNPNPGGHINGSYSGSFDADNALSEKLWPGEYLTVRWTGGDAGATVTAAYRGDIVTET